MHPILKRLIIVSACFSLMSACSWFRHDDKAAEAKAPAAKQTKNSVNKSDDNEKQKSTWQSLKVWCSDVGITSSVKFKLIKDPYINAINIKVITQDGVVILSGYVQKQSDLERAENLAKSTEGVVQTVNKLLVIFG